MNKVKLSLLLLLGLPFSVFAQQAEHDLCPTSLGGIAVHEQAKMCQQFNADEHSSHQSLSYYLPLSTQEAIAFYQQQHNELTLHSSFNGRVLLTMNDNNIRVAVSTDNLGSQIDILIL
ncbi:hypothetical protein [Alteromonas facilis]|uniref:hypothetical protein n=1 Tax=Alteromonas facilis TaxID=2048004 RepID=UPI000C28AE16|nr:hypothetical protein [Alteromonas facilis]